MKKILVHISVLVIVGLVLILFNLDQKVYITIPVGYFTGTMLEHFNL